MGWAQREWRTTRNPQGEFEQVNGSAHPAKSPTFPQILWKTILNRSLTQSFPARYFLHRFP
jgi:hypothetical protein